MITQLLEKAGTVEVTALAGSIIGRRITFLLVNNSAQT